MLWSDTASTKYPAQRLLITTLIVKAVLLAFTVPRISGKTGLDEYVSHAECSRGIIWGLTVHSGQQVRLHSGTCVRGMASDRSDKGDRGWEQPEGRGPLMINFYRAGHGIRGKQACVCLGLLCHLGLVDLIAKKFGVSKICEISLKHVG